MPEPLTSERWERAKEIFEAALEQPPERRSAFVVEACQGDNEIKAEVENLLLGDARAGANFLDEPTMPALFSGRPATQPIFRVHQVISRRFEILRFIGRGGMGEVYEAKDLDLGERVALKAIRPELSSDPCMLKRFRHELQLARRVTHPNVCRLHHLESFTLPTGDSGHTSGAIAFITMELLEGETLAERLRRQGRMDESEALPLVCQIADGLGAAHEVGVIHRDLKPGNIILVSSSGTTRAVVTDFGLARVVEGMRLLPDGDSTGSLSGSNLLIGTPQYMAPEQLQGGKITAATDVYALGLVMYEMVTGRRPFCDHLPLADAFQRLKQSPPSPRVHVPDLDRHWEQLILRCLETDPLSRYASARDVVGELTLKREFDSLPSETVGRVGHPVWGSRFAARTRVPLTILAFALVLAAAGFLYLRNRGAHQINSVAVLPLENLSGKSDQDYFADGMTDELITDLAKISSLRVTSRTSVMRYKGVNKPMPQIAKELKVDAIVEGSVLRAGDRVRIAAQLIEAANDRHIWGETYERDFGDVLALQSDVARTIAQEIRVRLTPEEQTRLAKSLRVNSAAYELYLQGRYHWNQRTPEGLQKGMECFKQAIAEDPGYALAYAGLADTYLLLGNLGVLELKVAIPDAEAAAKKALELDDGLAEAHASLGIASLFDHLNWQQAEKELKLAIQLNPNYATAHQWYASTLAVMGRPEDLVREARRAQELDPLSPIINAYLGRAYYLSRQYDAAVEQCQKTVKSDPGFPVAHLFLGMAFGQKGRHEEAVSEIQEAVNLSHETPTIVAVLGYAYAEAGKKEDAWRVLRGLSEPVKRKLVPSAAIAVIYAGLGEKDEAFKWLGKAQEEGSLWSTPLKLDPAVDSLRADPRFANLLHLAGLPAE
jgi:serine/threonine-protein kinase